jgi:hypothetical protein
MTTYLPDGQVRRLGPTVFDSHSAAFVSPPPARFRFLARGLGSCCDDSIVEAAALFHATTDRTFTYTVRAQNGPPKGAVEVVPRRRHKRSHAGGGGSSKTLLVVIGAMLFLSLALAGVWQLRRRRVPR